MARQSVYSAECARLFAARGLVVDNLESNPLDVPTVHLITHVHADHTYGVRRQEKPRHCVAVCGAPETVALLRSTVIWTDAPFRALQVGVWSGFAGFRVLPIAAWHMPGSFMYVVEFDADRVRALFTGDFRWMPAVQEAALQRVAPVQVLCIDASRSRIAPLPPMAHTAAVLRNFVHASAEQVWVCAHQHGVELLLTAIHAPLWVDESWPDRDWAADWLRTRACRMAPSIDAARVVLCTRAPRAAPCVVTLGQQFHTCTDTEVAADNVMPMKAPGRYRLRFSAHADQREIDALVAVARPAKTIVCQEDIGAASCKTRQL